MKLRYKILSFFPKFIKIPADYDKNEIGRIGEEVACAYLKKHRFKVLERNYKPYINEIDIIAEKSKEIVFVEVKTRSVFHDTQSDYYREPAEYVTQKQMINIRKAAKVYIKSHEANEYSFGVIEVYLNKYKKVKTISKIRFIYPLTFA